MTLNSENNMNSISCKNKSSSKKSYNNETLSSEVISNDLEVIGFILSVLEIILNNANPAFSKASFKLFPYA